MRLLVSLLRGEETLSHARWQITGSFYLFHVEDPIVPTFLVLFLGHSGF
jgi:hypothetical protein